MIIRDFKFLLLSILLSVYLPAFSQQDDTTTDINEEDNDTVSVDTTVVPVSTRPWPENVRQRLNGLLQNDMFRTSQLGMEVYDLTDDSIIFGYNRQQRMRPASTMKLITSISAINTLGGGYQFRTQLFYTGTVNDKTLKGNVYCVGGFDPRFNSDDMNAFVESIRKMGVDTIRGSLFADVSMKDADRLGNGWCWDDDEDPLSPLLISRKDMFMSRFVSELREAGIVVDSTTSQGQLPRDAYILCTRFHTIDQILMRMMKESDNLYAESMFYQIAASTGSYPATYKHARSVINQLISKLGLQPSDYTVADGSGLSLYNYVTPELEVAFLRYAYRNSNVYLHLYPSLPIAGRDGSLHNRMRSGMAAGNVHAKTGTVTGVSSLAGYCTAANGHVLCFSIINQGVTRVRIGRSFQDRVCQVLCQP
jgi:D-alanyl-D-alanine carboxypeptidase/D-alanyl-D-alanine-endopeptidase (penicillin-binding protein 4)